MVLAVAALGLLSDVDGSVVDEVMSSGQSAQPVCAFAEACCEIEYSAACVDGQELVVIALDAHCSPCYCYLHGVYRGTHFAAGWYFFYHEWCQHCVGCVVSEPFAFTRSAICRQAHDGYQ